MTRPMSKRSRSISAALKLDARADMHENNARAFFYSAKCAQRMGMRQSATSLLDTALVIRAAGESARKSARALLVRCTHA
jgi:hypothetical protein